MLRICNNLKSNMDRFIGIALSIVLLQLKDLKSNMDRFIVICERIFFNFSGIFKIQYG